MGVDTPPLLQPQIKQATRKWPETNKTSASAEDLWLKVWPCWGFGGCDVFVSGTSMYLSTTADHQGGGGVCHKVKLRVNCGPHGYTGSWGGVLALGATFRLGSPRRAPGHTCPNALKFKSSKLPQLKTNEGYLPFA